MEFFFTFSDPFSKTWLRNTALSEWKLIRTMIFDKGKKKWKAKNQKIEKYDQQIKSFSFS